MLTWRQRLVVVLIGASVAAQAAAKKLIDADNRVNGKVR